MRIRTFVVCATLLAASVMVTPAFGQDRTPDGQPNIQGVWTNFDPTPFEAPDDIDLKRLAPLAAWFPRHEPTPASPGHTLSRRSGARTQGPWGDGPGAALRNERRRSMIVDPPSGRAPLRASAIANRNQNLMNLTDDWLTHTPWERCITRGIPGGIFPGATAPAIRFCRCPATWCSSTR